MRFTALVQASGLHDVDKQSSYTFTDVFCRFGLVFFCFVFPMKMKRMRVDDAVIISEQSFPSVLPYSRPPYQPFGGRVCECIQSKLMLRTRFLHLHLMEEQRCCAI